MNKHLAEHIRSRGNSFVMLHLSADGLGAVPWFITARCRRYPLFGDVR